MILLDLIRNIVAERPEAIAIESPGSPAISYQKLKDQLDYTVTKLFEFGIKSNSPVAVVLPNGPEMAMTFLGVSACATFAPLNPMYRYREFDFFLSDLNASAILTMAGMPSPCREVAREKNIPIIELIPGSGSENNIFNLACEIPMVSSSKTLAHPGDIALILHTSGTTSRPKIVPLTHDNIISSAGHIKNTLNLNPGDRCLNVMPLFHIHGLIGALLSSLYAGAKVICTPGFIPTQFFQWVKDHQPTWYSAVPTMHQEIIFQARKNMDIIRQNLIRFIRSSSSSLAPKIMRELEEVFNAPVIESYGMTEASHQMTSNLLPPGERKAGSVGVPAGPDVAIMDNDNNLLTNGAIGEVVIRGKNVTKGYQNNPEANNKSFSRGWFRTGDEGYFDKEGYLFLTGRIKELINRAGEKISPKEVDEILLEHPAVKQAVTFAMASPLYGEEVAAVIILNKGYHPTELDLQKFAEEKLADYKVPKKIYFREEIPKGPTGKLQRIGLAEKLGIKDEGGVQETPYRAPETDYEKILCKIWKEVLQLDKIGIDDNFFYLGGNSVLVTQALSRIKSECGIEFTYFDFFEVPTIVGLGKKMIEYRISAIDQTELLTIIDDLENMEEEEAIQILNSNTHLKT